MQLVAADGLSDTNFVTVKCTVNEEGHASFDAFQLSKQCMDMVAEGALEEGSEPGWCQVNEVRNEGRLSGGRLVLIANTLQLVASLLAPPPLDLHCHGGGKGEQEGRQQLHAPGGAHRAGEIRRGAKDGRSVATIVYYYSTITNNLSIVASLFAPPLISVRQR